MAKRWKFSSFLAHEIEGTNRVKFPLFSLKYVSSCIDKRTDKQMDKCKAKNKRTGLRGDWNARLKGNIDQGNWRKKRERGERERGRERERERGEGGRVK